MADEISPGLFAPVGEVAVDLGDGWTAYMKQELDAGDQDDLQDHMALVRLDSRGTPGRDVELRSGTLFVLKLAILRIVGPRGENVPVTMENLRRLSRSKYARLAQALSERNRPLGDLMGKT